MKKIRLLLIAILLLGVFINSCNSDDKNPKGPDPEVPGYDTRNYPYKLNVVYFVPSDITPNPDYEERLTKILRDFRMFVCGWMEHWGYGYRSFGLPINGDGMVDIVLIRGKEPISGYPYDTTNEHGTNAKLKSEIFDYYNDNGLTWQDGTGAIEMESRHVLAIIATNSSNANVPFYGSGRWAFALDYPGMTAEAESAPGSKIYVGGMLHELMHGLNLVHVGPSYSQKNDSNFGMTLMGSGNQTYAKTPTFLHETSAAWLNNSKIAALTTGTFYDADATDTTIAQPEVEIDGGECTVSGTFTSNKTVTGVVVRFTNSSEANFMGHGSSGYTSFAAVAEPTGTNYELTIPINELRGIGATSLRLAVTLLLSNGLDRGLVTEPVYKLVNQGGTYTLTTNSISRTGWTVTTSQSTLPPLSANRDNNVPASLVDGNANTCLTLVKPGMTFSGVTIPENEPVWATIDMGKTTTFNTVLLNFNRYLLQPAWRAKKVSFYKSDNGVDFTLIKQAELVTDDPQKIQNVVALGTSVTCRYLRMTYDEWETASGNDGGAMRFSELMLQNN